MKISARLMIALWFLCMILIFCISLSGCSKPEVSPEPVLAGSVWEIRYNDAPEPWSKRIHFSSEQRVQIRMFIRDKQLTYESYEYLFGSPILWIKGPFDQNFKGVYYRDSLELQGEIYYPVKL